MTVEKKFDLLNSEGSLVNISKINGLWHFNFFDCPYSTITTPKDILSFISGGTVTDTHNKKDYTLSDYPDSMRGTVNYLQNVVTILLREEMERCTNDQQYFFDNYCKILK
jgi:hypothetical protein